MLTNLTREPSLSDQPLETWEKRKFHVHSRSMADKIKLANTKFRTKTHGKRSLMKQRNI
jgi:hypothetical protein